MLDLDPPVVIGLEGTFKGGPLHVHSQVLATAIPPPLEIGKRLALPTSVDGVFTFASNNEETAYLKQFQEVIGARTILSHVTVCNSSKKTLEEWICETLHNTFSSLALIGNRYFEVMFSSPKGAQHTFKNLYFYEAKEVHFATWHIDFSSAIEDHPMSIAYPVWAHFLGLPDSLRTVTGLTMLSQRLGTILTVETSDSFKEKTVGPRVRVLLKDVASLPQTCWLPRSLPRVSLEHKIIYLGRSNQCLCCKRYGHKLHNSNHPRRPEEGLPLCWSHDLLPHRSWRHKRRQLLSLREDRHYSSERMRTRPQAPHSSRSRLYTRDTRHYTPLSSK